MQRSKRAIANKAASDINRSQGNIFDPLILEPNDLCNKTQKALLALPEENRKSLRDKLLTGLRKASVNIASALLMLGIPARTPDELTPSDMGKLLRYVRINMPEVVKALAEPLAELLSGEAKPGLQKSRMAA